MSAKYQTEEHWAQENGTSIRMINKVPIYRWDEKRDVVGIIKTKLYDIFRKHAPEQNRES